MTNYVLMLAYNNADLTKSAIESVFAQTIPTHLIIVNNGSTDHTEEMLKGINPNNYFSHSILHIRDNQPPTIISNAQLWGLFKEGAEYVLCMANDVVLPPNFYEEILKWPTGITAASEIKDRAVYDEHIKNIPPVKAISHNTPMACLLLRRWVYEAVVAKDGYFFDPEIFNYASDCDLALRIAACGIVGKQLNLPYWHYSSASWRTRPIEEQQRANAQADVDRAYFARKWGFECTAFEYGACAVDINFRGEPQGVQDGK